MMKTKLRIVAAACTLFASSLALAVPQVLVNDKIKFADGNGASPGGAFVLTAWDTTGATPVSKGSFESFCLEKNEYMNYGGPAYTTGPTFKVESISTEAKAGGAGGQVASPYPHDPLDAKTAFLYTNYIETPSALNAVTGWIGASLIDKGTAMQQAIWTIEQELGSTSNTLANDLITFAGLSGWNDTGRVKVLNLTWFSGGGSSYPTGTFAQDQLYIAPVPEPETYAMMLAGLGLIGFLAKRRRRNLL
jgi:hypothetical protein